MAMPIPPLPPINASARTDIVTNLKSGASAGMPPPPSPPQAQGGFTSWLPMGVGLAVLLVALGLVFLAQRKG